MTPPLLDTWEGASVASLPRRWGVPGVEAHASIGSTNDRALEIASAGCAPFAVVLAETQTAGRGRRGARWVSPPGCGLAMSVVLPRLGEVGRPHLALLVGLATAEAIESCTGAADIGIKWPNDLYIGPRKVGGVLCEAVGKAVVAGIGINVRALPERYVDELPGTATSLEKELGIHPRLLDLAGSLIVSLKDRVDGAGARLDSAAHAAIARRDILRGRLVRSDQAGQGTASAIARDGALVLERADGSTTRVMAGSVRIS